MQQQTWAGWLLDSVERMALARHPTNPMATPGPCAAPPPGFPEINLADVLSEPDDIGLWASPWVSGTRAKSYMSPYTIYRSGQHLNALLNACVKAFQAKAASIGATDVTAVEINIDPWPEPPAKWKVVMTGTPAILVDL